MASTKKSKGRGQRQDSTYQPQATHNRPSRSSDSRIPEQRPAFDKQEHCYESSTCEPQAAIENPGSSSQVECTVGSADLAQQQTPHRDQNSEVFTPSATPATTPTEGEGTTYTTTSTTKPDPSRSRPSSPNVSSSTHPSPIPTTTLTSVPTALADVSDVIRTLPTFPTSPIPATETTALSVSHSESSSVGPLSDATGSEQTVHSLSSGRRVWAHTPVIERIKARDLHSSAVAKTDPDCAELKGLTCAVCLEVYRNPKFLPCHHTYCAACIDDLARRRPSKPFKCPSCRKEVVLPSGGANALQHNFYIKQEDLEKAARGVVDTSKCRIHPQQELDMYCTECELIVCFKCVLTKHKEHALQDLTEAAREAEDQLQDEGRRLDSIIAEVAQHVDRQRHEQNNFLDKMAAVKRNLTDRHDTIVAAAKLCLQQAVQTVDRVTEHMQTEVVNDAKFAESYLSSLCRLQKAIEVAIKTKAQVELVEADRDMRVGYGCREAVDELLAQRRTTIYRPVVHFGLYAKDVVQAVRQFFGQVTVVQMPADDSETMSWTEKFRCGDSADTEVYSICPKDNHTLSLSFERRNLNEQAPSEGVDDSGKHQYSRKEALGKATWKSRGKGKGVFVSQLPGQQRTYSKGQNTECFLRLDNNLNGVADIKKENIVAESPYKSRLSREGSVLCGPHRAFDANSAEDVFAVVEEASFPDSLRRVLLFHKNREDPVAVMDPPLAGCQPSDVCFCQLGDENVLLVSDERNDAIYALSYEGGRLTFLRYLAVGCPSLVQPTALNVDVNNKLWVACRGGSVLMIEFKSASPPSSPTDPAAAASRG